MIRVQGNIYKTTDKFIILILDQRSKEKVNAPSSFFKIDVTKCVTEDEILLNHGFIGSVSVLVAPVKYSFNTDKGRIEGVRYVAKKMHHLPLS